jgi:polysaccharide pyruvyl transferase WcaK-like protein
MRPTVAVIGNYGNRNLGDEATLEAIVHHLRSRMPGVRLVGLSVDPADTAARHGIETIPARRGAEHVAPEQELRSPVARSKEGSRPTLRDRVGPWIRRHHAVHAIVRAVFTAARAVIGALDECRFSLACMRRLRGIDTLVIGGGGQLADDFELAMLLRWAVVAKVWRARVVILNVGAGPLDSRWSRLLVRGLLYLADYHAFRDDRSRRLIEAVGACRRGPVFPDVVYGLPVTAPLISIRSVAIVVGVNLFPRRDPRYVANGHPAAYRAYLATMGAFVGWLLRTGHIVLLLPTQLRADPPVIDDLQAMLSDDVSAAGHRLFRPHIATREDLLQQIARVDLMVATRFHGILFSYLLGKPVLTLSDHPKMDDLAIDLGLSEYLLSLDRFELESVVARFTSLEADAAAVRARVLEQVGERRKMLEQQFDALVQSGVLGVSA